MMTQQDPLWGALLFLWEQAEGITLPRTEDGLPILDGDTLPRWTAWFQAQMREPSTPEIQAVCDALDARSVAETMEPCQHLVLWDMPDGTMRLSSYPRPRLDAGGSCN